MNAGFLNKVTLKFLIHDKIPSRGEYMNRQVTPGSVWTHFKGRHIATVIAVAKHTETEESLVVYDCYDTELKESSGVFARPLEMFLSEVDHDKYPEIKQRYRFERQA